MLKHRFFKSAVLLIVTLLTVSCSINGSHGVGTESETVKPIETTVGETFMRLDEIIIGGLPESRENYSLKSGALSIEISPSGAVLSAVSGKKTYISVAKDTSFSVLADPLQPDIWKTDPGAKSNVSFDDESVKTFLAEKGGSFVTLVSVSEGEFALLRRFSLSGEKSSLYKSP